MGACCGKPSPSTTDPFAQPGRTVGSIPAQPPNPTAPVPKKVGGPARALGPPQSTAEQDDARRKAAEAAEARANTGKPKGKLAGNLEAQKKQSRGDTLDAVSRQNRGARDADAVAETRAYN